MSSAIEQDINKWIQEIVINLQLCPFAKSPFQKQAIKITVSKALTEEQLIADLMSECERLDDDKDIETTLIVCEHILEDFFDFYQFLDWADSALKNNHWQGVYQLANFHPHYQFSGCEYNDPQNLTNRAPFPILHLLREASLSKILEKYPEPEKIPERNIRTMRNMSDSDKKKYFAYLFKSA